MPKITAPVQKFYVNRGDHVKQGQLLAVLENRDLIAAAAESQGAVDQAESNLRATEGATVPEAVVKAQTDVESAGTARDDAKKVLDSREQLFKQGALAQRLVDESRVAYAQADSQFRAAQEHLRRSQAVAKEEQIKGAAAQVQSAKAHLRFARSPGDLFPRHQPHLGHCRRPPAQCRRNGHPRHAAAHHHGYLARRGARQRSAGGGLRGESRTDCHAHAARQQGRRARQGDRGEPGHRPQQHHRAGLGAGR